MCPEMYTKELPKQREAEVCLKFFHWETDPYFFNGKETRSSLLNLLCEPSLWSLLDEPAFLIKPLRT